MLKASKTSILFFVICLPVLCQQAQPTDDYEELDGAIAALKRAAVTLGQVTFNEPSNEAGRQQLEALVAEFQRLSTELGRSPGLQRRNEIQTRLREMAAEQRQILDQLHVSRGLTAPDEVLAVALVPTDVSLRATFRLLRIKGRPGFFLARPGEQSEITLELQITYNIVTGKFAVTVLKERLVGEQK